MSEIELFDLVSEVSTWLIFLILYVREREATRKLRDEIHEQITEAHKRHIEDLRRSADNLTSLALQQKLPRAYPDDAPQQ